MYAGGTNDYPSKIYKPNFTKMTCFRLPNAPEIYFSKKDLLRAFPKNILDIPGKPRKTKPVKCIEPPP